MKIIKRILKLLMGIIISFIIILTILYLTYPKPFFHFELLIGNKLKWHGLEQKGDYFIRKGLNSIDGDKRLKYGEIYRYASIQDLKNGNYQQAFKHLNKAAQIDPEVDGYFGWVLLYYFKDYKRALFHLKKYKEYHKDNVAFVGDDHVSYAIGLCYKNLNQHELALINFDDAISSLLSQYTEEWITHQMYFQKARTLHSLMRYDEALKFYNSSLIIWPKSSETYFYKALLFEEINKKGKMCESLNKSYSLIKDGYKNIDVYISFFDEIYELQVLETLNNNCKDDY
ncbi:MAG: tetratricopeptide repeat protein [Flavobacteriales bacterium]|jgi:tetratricopeptide (TPR) repeat protein|nr:tetratricopeptide repeat protein [Flavobacteriales bacterium]